MADRVARPAENARIAGQALCSSSGHVANEKLVRVAPDPVLATLDRADKRVAGLVIMPARVAVGRGVTASDVPARQAQSQMDPVLTGLDTVFTVVLVGLQDTRFAEV
jgi:hypothetical protein